MKTEFNPIEQVKEFHTAFDHPVLSSPAIPSKDRCNLRFNLLYEEVQELNLAMQCGNVVDAADALCDIQYVLSGAILELGMQEKFPALFNEVHRSNMSKSCESVEQAERTKEYHEKTSGEPCHIVDRHGRFFVYRTRDMKTMKSIDYSPADLKGIILQSSV